MATPKPGSPVRGSTTGRPLMALLDLLGRRWSMRLLWELNQCPGSFRDLQGRCDQISSSVLNRRLAELREAGLVELVEPGYGLSAQGAELMTLMAPLRQWAARWGRNLSD